MAEKRMISKVISISEKVNELPDIFDMLLFTWMIPHTDDFGRLAGSPGKVKGLVVPMLDKTKLEIAESLRRLDEHGLIHWYEVDGEMFIQIIQFDKHQQGLHKRTNPKFPEFPGTSGNFPTIPPELNRTELKGTEENLTEEKGTEQEQNGTEPVIEALPDSEEDQLLFGGGPLPSVPDVFKMFEAEGFGLISPSIKDNLEELITTYSERWVCEAMKKSSLAGKRNLSYVQGILKRWKADGIDEPWTKEKPPAPAGHKGSAGGYSGKQHIEIYKPPLNDPTPEELAEHEKAMAALRAKKEAADKALQEKRDRGEPDYR